MANVDGTWETVTQSPMGNQAATVTVNSSGDSFTGTFAGALGSTEITDGKVNGDTISWSVNISVPMPMTLEISATVDGDTLSGSVKAGAFGSFPITGKRA
jgi:hypothetical protein